MVKGCWGEGQMVGKRVSEGAWEEGKKGRGAGTRGRGEKEEASFSVSHSLCMILYPYYQKGLTGFQPALE